MEPEQRHTYRYPGVRPFSQADQDVFFGRDDEITHLFQMIMLERTVILFGKSGHGKSSLISAGIIPLLNGNGSIERFHYHPVEVRIGKVKGEQTSPVEKVYLKLNEQFEDKPEWAFLDSFSNLPDLWLHFKKKQSAENRKFILIFDQFEEFFSYPPHVQDAFKWELAHLVFNEIPQAIREKVDEIPDEQYALLSAKMDVKVLFSIRSDRLSLFHSLKDALPDILHNRYEITSLSVEQAREAIIQPASLKDSKFITHPFTYDPDALAIILHELSTIHGEESDSIEAFHLQIICQACETKIEDKLSNDIVDAEINTDDLPEFRNLYEEYYKRQIERLPLHEQGNAQLILEKGLLYEDEVTGESHRLSVDRNILKKQFNEIKDIDDILNSLENSFLIRREANTVKGFSYEISHDTLLEPIIKVKHEKIRLQEFELQKYMIRKETIREIVKKFKKPAIYIPSIIGTVLAIILSWRYIYFFLSTAYFQLSGGANKDRPILRNEKELVRIIDSLKMQMLSAADNIEKDVRVTPWTASQVLTSLGNDAKPTHVQKYLHLTGKSLDTNFCGWFELKDRPDLRASGWIVSTIGTIKQGETYPCELLKLFLANQLSDGSWSAYIIDKYKIDYGSTYSTCLALRSLYNAKGNIADSADLLRVNACIVRGANWLKNQVNNKNPRKSLWLDYPREPSASKGASASVSGLAIHTLNLLNMSVPDLNARFLSRLGNNSREMRIYERGLSDVVYNISTEAAQLTDYTRHVVIPWEIIGTVDAYRSGSPILKFRANLWLDEVLHDLDLESISDNPVYVKAEILIALRYLQDKNFQFR